MIRPRLLIIRRGLAGLARAPLGVELVKHVDCVLATPASRNETKEAL